MLVQVDVIVNASIEKVWEAWTNPADIMQWNFASDDWMCPKAENNLTEGGTFKYRMEAKDGSIGFDFEGRYTKIEHAKRIDFELEDSRKVQVLFSLEEGQTKVTELFEAEDENSAELQKQGWQSILNNFKKHIEYQNSDSAT